MEKTERDLTRQAYWQRTRVALSWPERVRMAEQVRASVETLQRGRSSAQAPGPTTAYRLPPTAADWAPTCPPELCREGGSAKL